MCGSTVSGVRQLYVLGNKGYHEEDTPDFTGDTTITNVTDAATGLTIQVRDRYDGRMGRQEVSYTIMYGFAAGQKSALQKIVTA